MDIDHPINKPPPNTPTTAEPLVAPSPTKMVGGGSKRKSRKSDKM